MRFDTSHFFSGKNLPLTRPFHRLFLSILTICLTYFLVGSLYHYIVHFHIPSLTVPVRRDLSKQPLIKDQATSLHPVVLPKATKHRVYLLVLVSSGANSEVHLRKRMAIRNTWGKPSEAVNQWRVTFFLGKAFKPSVDSRRFQEAERYRDMIIGDFPDTYRNITKKLMMALKWASGQNYDYLLKTDDDVYINIPSLIQWIQSRPSSSMPLYAGVLYRSNVIRDKTHRHFVSWDDLPQKRYPWYPKGALYVLSGEIVEQMVEIGSKVKQITVDDAYVGVLASYLGIQPIRLNGFIQWAFLPQLVEHFDKCTYMNIFGMADNLTPKDLYYVHHQVMSYRNSSKWMCIHIYHPVLFTGLLLILVILFVCSYMRNNNISLICFH